MALSDALFDRSPIAMYVCEQHTRRILAANDAAVAMYGYPREQLCSMTTFDLRPPDEHARLRRWIEAGDAPSTFANSGVWRQVRSDGAVISVEIASIGGLAYDGCTAVFALLFDVSEREQRTTTLSAYRTALEEAESLGELGTIMMDARTPTCRLTGIMARAFRATELSLADHRRLALQIVPEESLAQALRLIDAARRMEPYECELQVYVDGEPRWMHARRSVLRDDHGEPIGSIGMMRDINERKLEAKRLRALAFTDRHTGIMNWTGLIESLPSDRAIGAVLLVRLSWLAAAAERVPENRRKLMSGVAAKLQELAGADATILRYERETFAVVLPSTPRARVPIGLAERIVAAFERPVSYGEQHFVVVPAIGICAGDDPAHGPSDLAARAEAALKEASAAPSRIAVYSESLAQAHDRRVAIEQHLRFAVSDRSIGVAYQPIVSAATGNMVGAEALMRWECPGIGPVPPAEFIVAAEETGAILVLGEWILREACAQARRWQLQGGFSGRIAVNVSALQVQQRDFVTIVASACEAANLHPSHLELEITERVMLQRDGYAVRNLDALRCLGVRISVDDFGTGYSSLSTLATLPLDTIKLDRSFIETVPDDPFQADMVQSIINLAHRRGANVVGEGVESCSQAQALRRMGCDEAQGFLFGRPMSAHDVEVLMATSGVRSIRGREGTAFEAPGVIAS